MPEYLFLKPDEGKFLAMCILGMMEQLQDTSKDERINWNPETRKDLKDMLSAGESLRIKLVKLGFDMEDLPPYLEGDEDEFLTKQS